jgi:hypothetical protein
VLVYFTIEKPQLVHTKGGLFLYIYTKFGCDRVTGKKIKGTLYTRTPRKTGKVIYLGVPEDLCHAVWGVL